jgi:hypothetical protein
MIAMMTVPARILSGGQANHYLTKVTTIVGTGPTKNLHAGVGERNYGWRTAD